MEVEAISRNASASARGWDFQANAAIVLFIRNIRNVREIRVEGELDDIELFLNDGTKLYAQAKARTTANPGDGSSTRFRDALKTLADDLKEEDCAQILYVTNDEYPFGRKHKLAMFGDDSLFRYDELPDGVRLYIKKAATTVGIKDESLELFSVCIVGFYGDDDDTRYRVVHQYVDKLISDLKLNRYGSVDSQSLRRTWDYMLSKNAANQNTGIRVDKETFVWPIVYALCEVSSDEKVFEDYDYDFQEEVLAQYRRVVTEHSNRFSLVTKIMSDFNDYRHLHIGMTRREIKKEFIREYWRNYEDEIGTNDVDDETSAVLIGLILQKVINKHDVIKKIKREVNLED